MKKMHAICGLPRSGSTLLCNVLNQNPQFYASSTSCLPQLLGNMSGFCSHSPEMKSDLHNDPEVAQQKLSLAMKSVCESWYFNKNESIIFDKSRLWNNHAQLFSHLYPEGKMLVCVRDLRSVFASIEKQNAKNPTLSDAQNPAQRSLYDRVDKMCSPDGLVGIAVKGIEDILHRKANNVVMIPYEYFSENPEKSMERIYDELGETQFSHDFDNVVDVSNDVDALYLYKYPHNGSGKIEKSKDKWEDWVSEDIANFIMGKFETYNDYFGYTK